MKQSLNLKVSQNLALTPQLQQAIKLLQLSSLELEQEVEQMLEENPFLEREEDEAGYEEAAQLQRELAQQMSSKSEAEFDGDGLEGGSDAAYESASATSTESAAEATEPQDWDGDGSVDTSASADEWGDDAPAGLTPGSGSADEDFDPMSLNAAHESLQDHLHRQALSLHLSQADQAALYFLIESLNDDGYLEDSLVSLAQSITGDAASDAAFEQMEETLSQLQIALKLLQSLDPAGVGARDLAECLKIQLLQLPRTEARAAALVICARSLDVLAKKDVRGLMQVCGADEDTVREAMTIIKRLEPKPARRFAQAERNIIVPDVIVRAKGRGKQCEFVVQLNNDVMPRLRVHSLYASALKNSKAGQAQQSLQDARNFIKNIQQRFDTILRTSQAIVEHQRNFFLQGEVGMKPLILREIADELGLHESTISRVTTNKYMATPQGTFELKYFFSSSLGTQGGSDTSSTAVRALIKQLIDGEDKAKPLSDQAIADVLSKQGIDCARRTVAKYREAMRLPSASLRKG